MLKEFSGTPFEFPGSPQGSDWHLGHGDTASGHHMVSSAISQRSFHPGVGLQRTLRACINVATRSSTPFFYKALRPEIGVLQVVPVSNNRS